MFFADGLFVLVVERLVKGKTDCSPMPNSARLRNCNRMVAVVFSPRTVSSHFRPVEDLKKPIFKKF